MKFDEWMEGRRAGLCRLLQQLLIVFFHIATDTFTDPTVSGAGTVTTGFRLFEESGFNTGLR